MLLFHDSGLQLIEELRPCETDLNFDSEMESIAKRANELKKKHPDKATMFEGYIQSQLNEYTDIAKPPHPSGEPSFW
jgi:hypothetical protein